MKPAVSQNKYAINSDGPLGTPRLRWRSTRYQATNGKKMSVPQYIQWGRTKLRLGIFPDTLLSRYSKTPEAMLNSISSVSPSTKLLHQRSMVRPLYIS